MPSSCINPVRGRVRVHYERFSRGKILEVSPRPPEKKKAAELFTTPQFLPIRLTHCWNSLASSGWQLSYTHTHKSFFFPPSKPLKKNSSSFVFFLSSTFWLHLFFISLDSHFYSRVVVPGDSPAQFSLTDSPQFVDVMYALLSLWCGYFRRGSLPSAPNWVGCGGGALPNVRLMHLKRHLQEFRLIPEF